MSDILRPDELVRKRKVDANDEALRVQAVIWEKVSREWLPGHPVEVYQNVSDRVVRETVIDWYAQLGWSVEYKESSDQYDRTNGKFIVDRAVSAQAYYDK